MPSPPPLGHPCMLVPAAPLLLGQSLARMSLPVPEANDLTEIAGQAKMWSAQQW